MNRTHNFRDPSISSSTCYATDDSGGGDGGGGGGGTPAAEPAALTAEAINKIISERQARSDKKLQAMLEERLGGVQSSLKQQFDGFTTTIGNTLEEKLKALIPQPAAASQPVVPAVAAGDSEEQKTQKQRLADLERQNQELQRQQKDLLARHEKEQKDRETEHKDRQAERERVRKEAHDARVENARTATLSVLTGEHKVKPAIAEPLIAHWERKGILTFDENGNPKFTITRVRFQGEDPEAKTFTNPAEALKDWAQLDEAKDYLPAAATQPTPRKTAAPLRRPTSSTPAVHVDGNDPRSDDERWKNYFERNNLTAQDAAKALTE